MKRIITLLFSFLLLAGGASLISSCVEEAPSINYSVSVTVVNDFTKVVEAINAGALQQAEATDRLTAAIDGMAADQLAKLEALTEVITSQANTLDTKLAAIEAALQAQTLSLEGKFELLKTAVENGTLKSEELAEKLAVAIDNLGGTVAEKLEAVKAVIESTSAASAEKIAAIEAALLAQTLSLEGKFDLLQAAVEDGTLKSEELVEKLAVAIDNLAEKFEAVKAIIESTSAATGEKLAALEAALKAQTLSFEAKQALLIAAVEKAATSSNATATQLAALEAVLKAQTLSLENKLELIKNAVNNIDLGYELNDLIDAVNSLAQDVANGSVDVESAISAIADTLQALQDFINEIVYDNTVVFDGVSMPVFGATIDAVDLTENNYDIKLNLSGDGSKVLNIQASAEFHEGRLLDLTQYESEHDGWYWVVDMHDYNTFTTYFETFAAPSSYYVVFLEGTLYVERIGSGNEFKIVLQNGRVKDTWNGDGIEHTISLAFKGELEVVD